MTTVPHPSFAITFMADDPQAVRVWVAGDLDHATADELTVATTAVLTARPTLRELRMDLTGLSACDSMGLSALLTVYRRAGGSGVRLRLENRPDFLERLLGLTGALKYFTGDVVEGEDTARPGSA